MYKIGGPADGVGGRFSVPLAGWLAGRINLFFAVLFHKLKIESQVNIFAT